ncbi:PTS galactitol transporter subunit IIC [Clostridium sediminicola]|uniref:PTS transporter subunit IIC n=1 Tax=Clostridium sediminicola TaxID=3114879 RepID=UPI0031F225D7
MQFLGSILDLVLSFKAYVMLPVLMMILSIFIRIEWRKAFKSCLTLGIGFIGIFVIFDYFVGNIAPALEAIIGRTGMNFDVLEVGWPPFAAMAWSFEFVPIMILLVFATNIVMVIFKWTHTINIDIWNFWHFIIMCQMMYEISGNIFISLSAAVLLVVITLKIADWSARDVEEFSGLEGVAITTVTGSCYYPIAVLGNSVLEKIPYINKIKADPEGIKDKLGFFGESMFIGFIMGLGLGIVAKYSIKDTLELAFNIAAVVFIIPKMCGILIEGLMPISSGMKEYIIKRFPKMEKSYIGLDFSVLLRDPAVAVTGILLMPVALVLALTLPRIRFIPLGDLPNMMGVVVMIVVACKGNVIRSIIIAIPILIGKLYASSSLAGLYTKLAENVNYSINGYDGQITGFLAGGNLLRYWIMNLFTRTTWAIFLVPIVVYILYYTKKKCET